MLKVVEVLIKLSYRGHLIGLINWYLGRVETTPPPSSEIITLPYLCVLKNRDFRRNLKIGCLGTVRVAIYHLVWLRLAHQSSKQLSGAQFERHNIGIRPS